MAPVGAPTGVKPIQVSPSELSARPRVSARGTFSLNLRNNDVLPNLSLTVIEKILLLGTVIRMQLARGVPLYESERTAPAPPSSAVRGIPGALCACEDDFLWTSGRCKVKPLRPQSVQAALRLVEAPEYDVRCAIVRPEFHHGGGLRLVARLRELRPLLPVLVKADKGDRELWSLAYCHGLELAVGDGGPEKVRAFVESSLQRPRSTMEQLEKQIEELTRRHSLTPSERRIAAAAVQGLSRTQQLASFEVSPNTLKSQTRGLLKKTGHSSLNEFCRVVLMGLVADAG